jgi:hypothetical protein
VIHKGINIPTSTTQRKNKMTTSVKHSNIKSLLGHIMGIGCAVYVSDQIKNDKVNWSTLHSTLIASDWRERNINAALVAFNKIAY